MAKRKAVKQEHRLSQRIFLLSLLVKRNIKNKYYRSVIGILWSVLNPLLNTLVMWFVFSNILGSGDVAGMPYILYILSGNIVFGLMSEATSTSVGSIVNRKGLLLSTPVPMEIFPLSSVFSSLASFAFSFISMIILMIVFQILGTYSFCWELILVITIIPAEVIFSIGIAFFLSTCFVFFRDIQHIYSVIMTLWRYITPVFYSLSRMGDNAFAKIMKFNPMYQYLTAFRDLMVGTLPSVNTYIACYGFALISLVIGWLFMHALKNHISSQL
ncbi:MAG: ABC transporter permease [Clostridia bacterium]|nr:ABC transporter permease [Clostridia bacterium]